MIILQSVGDRVIGNPPSHRRSSWIKSFIGLQGTILHAGYNRVSVRFDIAIDGYHTWDMRPIDLDYISEEKLELVKRHLFALQFL